MPDLHKKHKYENNPQNLNLHKSFCGYLLDKKS